MATPDRSPSLLIGQQWSAWTDLISSIEENGEEESEDENSKTPTSSSDSMKLGKCDMGLFGFCPSRDEFSLVVCEKCNLLVKPQALKWHIESRHGPTNLSSLGNVPAFALNSELGKKLLMPEPLKPTTTLSTTAIGVTTCTSSTARPSNGSFKQSQFGRPPTKASLKQVPASVRNVPAPRQGFSMKISPVKSVKGGNLLTTSSHTASSSSSLSSSSIPNSSSSSQSVSNPVVKVEKLQDRTLSASGSRGESNKTQDINTALSSLKSELTSPSNNLGGSSSSSSFTKLETSKISTLLSSSLKNAVSLTTPSSLTFSSLPSVSAVVSLAITKTSTDTPVNTRSLTTLVSTSTITKPIMITPVMTAASSSSSLSSALLSASSLSSQIVPPPKSSSGHSKPKKKTSTPSGSKFLPCKDREYDPDKHCGVLVADTGKQCTRSLTCKTHALSLRRAVKGRCKPLDDLLKEQKAIKDALLKAKAESQQQSEAAASANRILVSPSIMSAALAGSGQKTLTGSTIATISMDGKFTHLANAIVKSGLPPVAAVSSGSAVVGVAGVGSGVVGGTVAATLVKPNRTGHANVFQRFSSSAVFPPAITVKEENVLKPPDASSRVSLSTAGSSSSSSETRDSNFLPHHPRPLAVCTFGGRLSDRSCYLFSRKTDYVRAALLSALERQLSPPPHKKLCVESNLPKGSQHPVGNSQDPYEFNQIDTSGGGGAAANNAAVIATSLVLSGGSSSGISSTTGFVKTTTNVKVHKSKLPNSPIAASSAPSPIIFSPVSLSSPSSTPPSASSISTPPANLSPSLAAISPMTFNQPVRLPSRSAKSREGMSATLIPGQITIPGKRKRSGSSGNHASLGANNGSLSTSVANGPLLSSSGQAISGISSSGITFSGPVDLNNASQLGLAGIITTPTSLGTNNNHQSRNVLIPSVNFSGAVGAGSNSKLTTSASVGAGQKNNTIFKDLNFVLTGLDSSSLVNGQVVNITSAQLAELTANQGQTLVLNNFPVSGANNNSSLAPTGAQTVSMVHSGTSSVVAPRPSKRHRGSSGSRSHQFSAAINAGKVSANPLEGFKIIPTNNVITSGALPPNAVLMDSSSLQGAMLTSVSLSGAGGGTPTLVAITSTAGNSGNSGANAASSVLCADPGSTQLSHALLSNGLTQVCHDKSATVNSGQRAIAASPKSFLQHQQHGKNATQPGLALGGVIQGSSALGVPLTSVSASPQQICSNQALFKSGTPFNLTKGVGGKVTVQPVSLTFPINMAQQNLAGGLVSGKAQQSISLQQHQQQQQQGHTLLVATSGGGGAGIDDQAGGNNNNGGGIRSLHQQISNSSTSNVLS